MAERGLRGAPGNRLLAALDPTTFARIEPKLEHEELPLRRQLVVPDEPIEHVWFLDAGVTSLVSELDDDRYIEVATVGNEGMIGVPVFLGASATPLRGFVQIAGSARRMKAAAFRTEIGEHGQLRSLLQRYTQALFNQIAQTAACNRAHLVQQRCARWLLMTHDRVERVAEFPLTQEFLAQMLGVRRASVNTVAGELQAMGAIEYTRGVVTVLDRRRLEQVSCGCYARLKREYARLLGG